jgi:hypothetical protein
LKRVNLVLDILLGLCPILDGVVNGRKQDSLKKDLFLKFVNPPLWVGHFGKHLRLPPGCIHERGVGCGCDTIRYQPARLLGRDYPKDCGVLILCKK